MKSKIWMSASLLVGWASFVSGSAKVGSSAPAVEPSQWLNSPGAVSWHGLKGRLVLIEKWATW